VESFSLEKLKFCRNFALINQFKKNKKMKKALLFLAGISFIASMSLSSCKKCVDCSDPTSSYTDSFCGKSALARTWKTTMETGGYVCSYR